jgi:hypothetical protein
LNNKLKNHDIKQNLLNLLTEFINGISYWQIIIKLFLIIKFDKFLLLSYLF